ncbi:MAG: hypothetical protein NTX25_17380 [Proteobacteria bacterium]|nr:hypothetical protein [Pseudomonadota bacterium]
MRLIGLFKKLFTKNEVPLTPEQELALREQLRIMQDLDRQSQHGPSVPRTLPRGWDGVGGKAVEKHVWFGPKDT